MIETFQLSFLKQSLHMIEELEIIASESPMSLPAEMARLLHTIRGGSAIFDLVILKLFVQQAEYHLGRSGIDGKAFLLILQIKKTILEEKAKIHKLPCQPLSYLPHELKQLFERLALRLGKRVEVVISDPQEILVAVSEEFLLKVIFAIMINAIDHGLETSDERLQKRKFFPAKISLELSQEPQWITVRIADNGRGFSKHGGPKKSAVEQRKDVVGPRSEVIESRSEDIDSSDDAMELDVAAETVQSVSSLGTETGEARLSGTKQGLAIVNDFLMKKNGAIKIETYENEGTFIQIDIPALAIGETSVDLQKSASDPKAA